VPQKAQKHKRHKKKGNQVESNFFYVPFVLSVPFVAYFTGAKTEGVS